MKGRAQPFLLPCSLMLSWPLYRLALLPAAGGGRGTALLGRLAARGAAHATSPRTASTAPGRPPWDESCSGLRRIGRPGSADDAAAADFVRAHFRQVEGGGGQRAALRRLAAQHHPGDPRRIERQDRDRRCSRLRRRGLRGLQRGCDRSPDRDGPGIRGRAPLEDDRAGLPGRLQRRGHRDGQPRGGPGHQFGRAGDRDRGARRPGSRRTPRRPLLVRPAEHLDPAGRKRCQRDLHGARGERRPPRGDLLQPLPSGDPSRARRPGAADPGRPRRHHPHLRRRAAPAALAGPPGRSLRTEPCRHRQGNPGARPGA